MRRPAPNKSGIELAAAANRGMTRRSFLIAGTLTAGGIGAAAYAWNRYGQSLLETGEYSGKGVIHGEPLALTSSGMLLDTDFREPCAGGEFLGYLPFHSQEESEFRGKFGQNSHGGHDARLCLDLATLLTPQGRLTPNDQFFIRTENPDLLKPPKEWKIKIHGEVKEPKDVPLKSLEDFVEPKGPVLLECSGNGAQLKFGLLSVAEWAGIPIQKIIQLAHPTDKAKAIYINGFDDDSNLPDHGPPYRTHSYPTCSWIFPIEQLVNTGAFLATQMNGAPLPKDHGAPVRLIIPNWYGCSEVKWVNEIKFVDNNQKATWQMLEFSNRTNQKPLREDRRFYHPLGPDLARDYRPATIDQAAVPVRVEQWRVGGKILYRVVGITWGGPNRSENLEVLLTKAGGMSQPAPINFCKAATSNSQYGIWTQTFPAHKRGFCAIRVRVADSKVRSRRQKRGDYDRTVFIPDV
ncbi:MAG TPA: molybdopterin-dependent oxidoreductase [Planctomycetaceae bacterium]|nr:molybdopterin-dependent oxidoreductase [Planctomycetaceae bacterium]